MPEQALDGFEDEPSELSCICHLKVITVRLNFSSQEFALKACIEHFNATYYSLEGGASASGTTPPGQVGAGVGQQQQAAGTPAAGQREIVVS